MTNIQQVSYNVFNLDNGVNNFKNVSDNYGTIIKIWEYTQKYLFLFWNELEFVVLVRDKDGSICINGKNKIFSTIEGIPEYLKKENIHTIRNFFENSYVKINTLTKGYKVYVYQRGVGGMLRYRKLDNKENFINDLMKSQEEIFNSFDKFLYFHKKLKIFYNKVKESDLHIPEFENLHAQITNLVNMPLHSNCGEKIAITKSNIKDTLAEILVNVNMEKVIFWEKLSTLFLFTLNVWNFQNMVEECKERQNNEETKIILELESQIRQNTPMHSYTQYLDKLGYRYDFVKNPKIFDEIYEMFNKVKMQRDVVFDEILLFKAKIESAKEDLKNTETLCDLEEKIKTHSQLYKSHDDVKQYVYKIRRELDELKDRIRIKISQTLKEKKKIWQLSINLFSYVVQPSFWEKLSFLFYYLDKILEIEQNVCLYEKDLELISYQNAIEAQIEQINEVEKSLREAREKIYEEEYKQVIIKINEQKKQINQKQIEQKKLEQERLKQKRFEQERFKQERLDRERLEQERREQERLEQERCEQERLEQERREQERFEQERFEQEIREQERFEQERCEQERLEQERFEQERCEQERLEQERLEQERIVGEQLYKKYLLDLQEIQEQKEQNKRQLQQELHEIKLEADQQRFAQRLKYEQELKELNEETDRLEKEQKEKLAQELKAISNNNEKIIQHAKEKMEEISWDWKILEQETSEYLNYLFENTDRIEFYNLVIEKLRDIRILSKDMEDHRKVLKELLQIEKVSFFSVSYDKIIPILRSIDFGDLHESLTKLKEIKEKILGYDE